MYEYRDPIPLDEPEITPASKPRHMLDSLAPFLKASRDGLKAALDGGTVSDADRVLIKRCLDNVQNNRIVTDPFGGVSEYEDENFRTLRIMGEKYASTPAALAKAQSFGPRARASFHVGQKVRERFSLRRTATVTKVQDGAIHIDYGGGCSGLSTTDQFEPLEAA